MSEGDTIASELENEIKGIDDNSIYLRVLYFITNKFPVNECHNMDDFFGIFLYVSNFIEESSQDLEDAASKVLGRKFMITPAKFWEYVYNNFKVCTEVADADSKPSN